MKNNENFIIAGITREKNFHTGYIQGSTSVHFCNPNERITQPTRFSPPASRSFRVSR